MDHSFTHLHLASGYSFKYGTALPAKIVERAAELEMSAIALTDRETLAGVIRFVGSCIERSIAPIIGVDLPSDENTRITLLATPGRGWNSLVRLVTAWKESHSPLTPQFLREHSDLTSHLLALHGPDSDLGRAIVARRYEKALAYFNQGRELFLDQSIECVSHLVYGDGPRSTIHAARMLGFARDHDLPALLTNAARMMTREDAPIADILDATRHHLPLHKKVVERRNAEAFIKDSHEMSLLADQIARAAGERSGRELLRTTRQWAERSILSPQRDIGVGSIHLPEPEVVGARDQAGLVHQLRERSYAGVDRRYRTTDRIDVIERLEKELSIIRELGYESYFLTVADITDRARAAGIRVAARGSGAGSLVCHLLGISGVEPLSLGLLMERFCSPLRRALPDIDIDVESARRLEIYDQVFAAYGKRAATVAMIDTYRARHAIRDVGAALALPPMEIDLVAKSLPYIRARNIKASLENLPELKNLHLTSPLWQMAIGLAERLDGLPRNLAMHPCAVVLSDSSLYERAPIERNVSGYQMVQWDKDDVEAIGLLKLDILGVRMQSSLAYAISEIKRTKDEVIDLDAIPLDDPDTFSLIQSTKTLGLFQIESPGQRELVGKFSPETFTDLIIDISLFRPGPVKSDMITPFLNARQGWSAREIFHPDLAPILASTEGVVVFHEQVIEIIATMSGASLAEADEKRRALGDRDGQQEVCDWFFPAATARGYSLPLITKIWDVLRAFASFGFCKAHAAAFALPTYQSAWLKTHYPAAFLAGVLTHDPGMYPKRLILDEVRQQGIDIAPLDINRSDRSYRVEGSAIRLALTDLSGISEGEVDSIIAHRPYCDLADVIHRSGISRPTAEALLMVGAFDALHPDLHRRDLLLHLTDLYRWARSTTRALSTLDTSQLTFGFTPPVAKTGLPDLRCDERVRNEMEFLGMDISHHMIDFYAEFLNQIGAIRSCDLLHQRSKSSVLVAGVKVALQTPPIRSGKRVMFLTLDDGYGCSDTTFFEDAQRSCAETVRNSSLLLVRGEIRRTGARGISLRATEAWELSRAYEKWRSVAACE